MCDEGKNVSERLKKQDKEGENTAKIVYNAQKRCKLLWKNTFTFPYITGNIEIVTQK